MGRNLLIWGPAHNLIRANYATSLMFINDGYYASFSDLVRTSVRELLERRYQKMIDDSERDIKEGKAVVLKSAKEIEEYINCHMK